jgi:tetrahydromethanopterin S-methyltransferase subunit G
MLVATHTDVKWIKQRLPEIEKKVESLESSQNKLIGGIAVLSTGISFAGSWVWNRLFGGHP